MNKWERVLYVICYVGILRIKQDWINITMKDKKKKRQKEKIKGQYSDIVFFLLV